MTLIDVWILIAMDLGVGMTIHDFLILVVQIIKRDWSLSNTVSALSKSPPRSYIPPTTLW